MPALSLVSGDFGGFDSCWNLFCLAPSYTNSIVLLTLLQQFNDAMRSSKQESNGSKSTEKDLRKVKKHWISPNTHPCENPRLIWDFPLWVSPTPIYTLKRKRVRKPAKSYFPLWLYQTPPNTEKNSIIQNKMKKVQNDLTPFLCLECSLLLPS